MKKFSPTALFSKTGWLVLTLFFGCQKNWTRSSSELPQTENQSVSIKKEAISAEKELPTAKNIIFMIGDGTALAHVTALLYEQGNQCQYEKFPVVGFHKSYSSSDLVTDSAAGATAFSCGCKTYNSAIGMNADTLPCRTILEELKAAGYATGMDVACSASHATPAAFVAHQKYRTRYYEIAEDYMMSNVDCVVAAGGHYFTERDDKRNLLKELAAKGYDISQGHNLRRAAWGQTEKPILFITDDNEPESALNDRKYLPESVTLTTAFLKKRSEKGFFLMVEGSQIDWACHANDANWMVAELKDFDKTIAAALEFAQADGETLVVVTGDHDGGGVSIEKGSTMGHLQYKWGSKDHGGVMVPVFAMGPGAERFSGVYENTDIHTKLLEALGRKAK